MLRTALPCFRKTDEICSQRETAVRMRNAYFLIRAPMVLNAHRRGVNSQGVSLFYFFPSPSCSIVLTLLPILSSGNARRSTCQCVIHNNCRIDIPNKPLNRWSSLLSRYFFFVYSAKFCRIAIILVLSLLSSITSHHSCLTTYCFVCTYHRSNFYLNNTPFSTAGMGT